MTKFSFVSLGCPKNLVDTEIIAINLINAGFEFVPEGDEDAIIVNTCSFLKRARDETYSEIAKQLMRKSCGDIDKVFVAGCILRSHYSELLDRFPQIDGVIPFPIDSEGGVLENFIGDLSMDSRILLTQKHTAYLRISYGCDNKCTYCLIPQIRGGYRSRSVDDIIAEVKGLVDIGVKEIIIISEDTSYYGRDLGRDVSLSELLLQLNHIEGIKWLRLLYLNPFNIKDELLTTIKNSSKVLPYMDIPLQHISKPILKRMGRKLSKKPLMEWLEYLKKTIPELALRTTFIVGFPGETEEQFNELLNFVDNSQFFHIGAFPYSKEKGTKAFSYKNNINRRVVERRLRKLYNLSHTITINNKKQLIGQTSEVIIERISDDKIYGRAWFQAPDIDGDAIIKDKGHTKHRIGDIINCSLEKVSGHRLIFKHCNEPG